MQITPPTHNRYVLNCLDDGTYFKYVSVYLSCKQWNVQRIYSFLGGKGLWGVAKEVTQVHVVQYGKRRLATSVIGGATYTYICGLAIAIITNVTRVVKLCKLIYT